MVQSLRYNWRHLWCVRPQNIKKFTAISGGFDYASGYRRLLSGVSKQTPAKSAAENNISVNPISISRNSAPIEDRQEAILLSKLPKDFCTVDNVLQALQSLNILPSRESMLIMRDQCGIPTGKVLVLTKTQLTPQQCWAFPPETTATLLDYSDVANWIERLERYQTLSDDLRWLAKSSHFNRTVTVTGLPDTYGRREVRDVFQRYAEVDIAPTDVVFQFDAFGDQTDTAWVVCPSEQDSNRVLERIQELAVPQRVQYASLFGCAFLSSRRNSFFISGSNLDFALHRTAAQVLTLGWDALTSVEDLKLLLQEKRLLPERITRIVSSPNSDSVMFLLECGSMKEARDMMRELERMRQRWNVPKHKVTYALPRQADIRWEDENGDYADTRETDSDIEDPIDY